MWSSPSLDLQPNDVRDQRCDDVPGHHHEHHYGYHPRDLDSSDALEAFNGSRETCNGSRAVRVTSDVSNIAERDELDHHAEQHRVACVAAAQLVSVARHISDPDVTCTLR